MRPSPNLLPFDDINALIDQMPDFDLKAANAFASQASCSVGRISEVGGWMAGWQGQIRPTMRRPVVALFAASHAIANDPVARSAFEDRLDLLLSLVQRIGDLVSPEIVEVCTRCRIQAGSHLQAVGVDGVKWF